MARTISKSRFAGFQSRLRTQARNNLGTIMTSDRFKSQIFRDAKLDTLDQYYEGSQYDGLQDWEEAAENDDYVAIRKRKPRIIYGAPKVLVDKVAAKLVGTSVFPKFVVEDDPDDSDFFRIVQKACNFRGNLIQPMKHCLTSGSVLVRFYLVDGSPIMEHFNAKYCYPQFDQKGELDQVEIKYIYEDPNDKKANGEFKKKWYRLVLTKNSDILYNNPDYQEGNLDPDFTVVDQADHQLGWVQGEWLRTSKHKYSPDGGGLFADILDFFDELNYSLSQTSQAVSYNQEPQLAIKGVDEDEIEGLIRSSQKAWALGRDGEAKFIEANGKGIELAGKSREETRKFMLEVVRVVLHDPEKMTAQAQSGKALEILHAPLVELIDELRTVFEPMLKNLLIKIGMTMLEMGDRGEDTVLQVPAGYMPASLDITVQWPAIFPPTLDDINKMVTAGTAAANAKVMSRETVTKWLAPVFGVENVEEEIQKIGAEPDINPFGGGFGGGFGQ